MKHLESTNGRYERWYSVCGYLRVDLEPNVATVLLVRLGDVLGQGTLCHHSNPVRRLAVGLDGRVRLALGRHHNQDN